MRRLLLAGLGLATSCAIADDSGFPEDSKPLDEVILRQRISGHDFISPSFNQYQARYQFYADGTVWLHLGSQYDKGPWRIEKSSICVDWHYGTPGCFEVRELNGRLYTRRGEFRPE